MVPWRFACLVLVASCGRIDFALHRDATGDGTTAGPTPALVIGDDHACLRGDTSLKCWGQNDNGQLGLGDEMDRLAMTIVPGAPTFDIALGQNHTCALDADGRLWCWGMNVHGELGCAPDCDIGVPAKIEVPRQLPDSAHYNRVFANHFTGCAIATVDDSAWCWGDNSAGQLGVGDTMSRPGPTRVLPAGTDRWKLLALGNTLTCGVQTDDTTWCWGTQDHGALGNGAITGNATTPQLVGTYGFTSLDAGTDFACGVLGGDLLCWGNNDHFQLGIPGGDSPTPVPTARHQVQQVNLGTTHACARYATSIECWGANGHGELGTGATSADSASGIELVRDWTEVASGNEFSCGLDGSNQVWCWGINASGQLASGDTTDRASPIPTH